ncbi:toxin TcdB middle/C-terminal domain-containing protein [Pseudomonas corrugata]
MPEKTGFTPGEKRIRHATAIAAQTKKPWRWARHCFANPCLSRRTTGSSPRQTQRPIWKWPAPCRVACCEARSSVDRHLKTTCLYSVQENRYGLRLLQAPDSARRHAQMLPLLLETITYQYEGITDDPQCQHTLNLQHDLCGALTHSVDIHYARRKTASDTPPFSDADQQQWWRDAHDPAQQLYHLSETHAEFIHLQAPQQWRLGLPYRQRTQAWQCPKPPEDGGWRHRTCLLKHSTNG